MYTNILIATDGSDVSRHAAEHAIALAKALGGSARAIFVIDTRTFPGTHPIVPESMAPHYFSLLEEMRKAGEVAVGDVREAAEKDGVSVATDVVEGTPAASMLKYAKDNGSDLIVMGTHGRSGFAALLLGSTAHAVVHGAEIPVLLVR